MQLHFGFLDQKIVRSSPQDLPGVCGPGPKVPGDPSPKLFNFVRFCSNLICSSSLGSWTKKLSTPHPRTSQGVQGPGSKAPDVPSPKLFNFVRFCSHLICSSILGSWTKKVFAPHPRSSQGSESQVPTSQVTPPPNYSTLSDFAQIWYAAPFWVPGPKNSPFLNP